MIGDGSNLVDFTYVENVAYAHVLAATRLTGRDSPLCGQAYFITNQQPVLFWDFFTLLYRELGYEEPWLPIPISFPLLLVPVEAVNPAI